jgi:divalent metal cation (Fe/Co/Zn/Cd) transporter
MSFPSPRTRHELSQRRGSFTSYTIVAPDSGGGQLPALGPASPDVVAGAPATDAAPAAAADAAAAAGPSLPSASGDLEEPLLLAADAHAGASSSNDDLTLRRRLDVAYNTSWAVNLLLMAAKSWAYAVSGSKAVLASAADSAVDLASQGVIAWADAKSRRPDPRFPVGSARLEVVGVIVCACIMSAAAYAVVAQSLGDLWAGLRHANPPQVDMGIWMYGVLGVATVLKAGCFVQCAALRGKSDSMVALAEDHLNDIVSNLAAIGTALAAQLPWPLWLLWRGGGADPSSSSSQKMWAADPIGAILISIWIVSRWLAIFRDAVDKLCGRSAPEHVYAELERLAREHDPQLMELDVVRAYSVGPRFLVEVEVTMAETTILRVSHDAALQLQHRIEALPEVERAFVHVDYVRRGDLEHKPERALFGDRATLEQALRAQRSGSLGASGGGGGGGGVNSGGGS